MDRVAFVQAIRTEHARLFTAFSADWPQVLLSKGFETPMPKSARLRPAAYCTELCTRCYSQPCDAFATVRPLRFMDNGTHHSWELVVRQGAR